MKPREAPFVIINNRDPEWAKRRAADIIAKRLSGISYEEIGRSWDISRERVRQIHKSALIVEGMQ